MMAIDWDALLELDRLDAERPDRMPRVSITGLTAVDLESFGPITGTPELHEPEQRELLRRCLSLLESSQWTLEFSCLECGAFQPGMRGCSSDQGHREDCARAVLLADLRRALQ